MSRGFSFDSISPSQGVSLCLSPVGNASIALNMDISAYCLLGDFSDDPSYFELGVSLSSHWFSSNIVSLLADEFCILRMPVSGESGKKLRGVWPGVACPRPSCLSPLWPVQSGHHRCPGGKLLCRQPP